jgi:DNA-binding beta-propeller fold protein YncE
VAFGAGPRSGTYDSSNGKVYVVNSYAGAGGAGSGPDVLDAIVPTMGTAAEIVSPGPSDVSPVGAGLVGVSYDPTTDRLFTADESWSEGTILGGESDAWEGNLSLPFAPVAVADDPVRSIVYFASNTGEVAGFDAGNLTPTGPWNMTPPAVPWTGPSESLAVDPETGDVLVLEPDLGPSAVSVLWVLDPANGTTRSVPLGGPGAAHAGNVPVGVAFDPADGDAYVAENGGMLLAGRPGGARRLPVVRRRRQHPLGDPRDRSGGGDGRRAERLDALWPLGAGAVPRDRAGPDGDHGGPAR